MSASPVPATVANDCVHRFLFNALDIRGQVLRVGPAWRSLLEGRDYPEPVITVFGELLAVAILLGTGLKHPGRVTIQIQGDGPIDLAVADCTHDLKVRGMVRCGDRLKAKLAILAEARTRTALPATGIEKLTQETGSSERITFADLVGEGKLAISIDNQLTGQIYQSFVPIDGLSVAECFESYFDQSEQLPTHLWLSANESYIGAMLLQKLPLADKKDPDGWARVDQLASTVADAELIGLPAQALLRRLFHEEDVHLLTARPVNNGCKRDPTRVEEMLRTLGRKELDDTVAEQGEVIVRDDMCNFEYRFDAEAIAKLFEEPAQDNPAPKQVDDTPNKKQPPTVH
jgi:molecular chaperone Hsp33